MRPAKQARRETPQASSLSASLFAHFVCSDDEHTLQECAESILEDLDSSSSLLSGMFKSFLQEARILPSAKLCRGNSHAQQHHQQPAKRPRETELLLTVTLEDLYNGAVKSVPVQRQRHDGHGHLVPVQEQLQVRVQPGVTEGTRITLPGQGNEDCCGMSADLTFIVQQQLHPSYRRLADDLYAVVNVPLVTALTGGPVSLRTLSGQLLQLPVDDIITPGSELVLPNHGMPVFGDRHGRRGALHVKFDVSFPQKLSYQQQVQLRMTLGDSLAGRPSARLPAGLPALPAADQEQPTAADIVHKCQVASAKQQEVKQEQHQHMLGTAHRSNSSAVSLQGHNGFNPSAPDSMASEAAGSSAACNSSVAGFACTYSTSSSRNCS